MLMAEGVRGREAPVLALGRETVRGRADAATVDIEWAMGPEVRPATVRGQSEIMIETDRHADGFGMALDVGELGIDCPCEPGIEFDEPGMGRGEGLDGGGVRVLEVRRPIGPDPELGVLFVQGLVDGAVDSILTEQVAFGLEVGAEIGLVCLEQSELPVQLLQEAKFEPGYDFVLDEGGLPKRFAFRHASVENGLANAALGETGDALDVDVEKIPIEGAVREIGAGVVRKAIRDGVQGVKGDKRSPGILMGPGGEVLEIGRVADSPVAPGTQAV